MANHTTLQREFMVNLYPNRGLTLVRGEGVHLISEEGDRYLDMATNYGVSILGYGHPGLENAIVDQWRTLPTLHCSFTNDVRALAPGIYFVLDGPQAASRKPQAVHKVIKLK